MDLRSAAEAEELSTYPASHPRANAIARSRLVGRSLQAGRRSRASRDTFLMCGFSVNVVVTKAEAINVIFFKAMSPVHGPQIAGFLFRGVALALGFLITYLVARWFGPAGNGLYALLTQTGMFLSALVAGGLDLATTREFSRRQDAEGFSDYSSFWRLIGYTLLASATVSAGYALVMLLVTHESEPISTSSKALLIISLIVVTRSLTRLIGAFLRAHGRYSFGQAVEVLFIPASVLLFSTLYAYGSVEAMLGWTVLFGAVTALLALVASQRFLSKAGSAPVVPLRDLLMVAWPLWGVGVSLSLADWYSVLIVSTMLDLSSAGIFRVAVQIGTAVAFGTAGMMTVLSAQMSRATDDAEVGKLIGKSIWLNVLFSVIPIVVLAIFSSPILLQFGPEYVSGSNAIRILLVGQLLYSFTSPAGQALAVLGFGRANLVATSISIVCFLGMTPVLISLFGLNGAALSTMIFLVMRNLIAIGMLRRLSGLDIRRLAIDHFPSGFFR